MGGSLAAVNVPAGQSFSYNPDNSLQKVGSNAVTNDNNGNILCIAGNVCSPNEFSYDERGRLQQWAANPYAVDYNYDAFGRRYERNAGGVVDACYVYDGLNAVAATFDCNSGLGVTSYLDGLGLDELFMMNNGANESFLRDAQNSTIALTSASGSIVDSTKYDPYGNTTDTAPAQASAFEFAGRENESSAVSAGYYYSNLYFMRGRYYDAAIGRFISRDPVGLAGGVNLYEYAGDSPTNATDPLGLDFGFGPWGGYYSYGNGVFPGVETGTGPSGGGVGGVVGGFVYQPLALLVNQGGLDRDVTAFYYGGQNGGGIAPAEIILARYFIPFSSLPEDTNEPPGEGWVRRGPNWWNPQTGQSLHHDPQHPLPKGPHYDLHNRYPTRWKLSIRLNGPSIEFWSEDLLEWLPLQLLPIE